MQDVERKALERDVLAKLRALSAADGRLNAAVAAVLGIHPTDLEAGDALGRRGPMTIGELARQVRLSPGAATALVDRLERARLARRKADPASRRRVLVTPLRQTAARVAAIVRPITRDAQALVAGYSDRDLELITEFLTRAAMLLEKHGDEIEARLTKQD